MPIPVGSACGPWSRWASLCRSSRPRRSFEARGRGLSSIIAALGPTTQLSSWCRSVFPRRCTGQAPRILDAAPRGLAPRLCTSCNRQPAASIRFATHVCVHDLRYSARHSVAPWRKYHGSIRATFSVEEANLRVTCPEADILGTLRYSERVVDRKSIHETGQQQEYTFPGLS